MTTIKAVCLETVLRETRNALPARGDERYFVILRCLIECAGIV